MRFMTAQALQSHRRHKHPGAPVLAPGGGAPALAVEPAPGGGHAGPDSSAPAAAPLSGLRGAPKRSRFTGHEKVDLVKRAIGMGQRAVSHVEATAAIVSTSAKKGSTDTTHSPQVHEVSARTHLHIYVYKLAMHKNHWSLPSQNVD